MPVHLLRAHTAAAARPPAQLIRNITLLFRQVALRNEVRQSLDDVETRLEKCETEGPKVDPVVEAARAKAKERQKLPLHLRGTIVLT